MKIFRELGILLMKILM